MKSTGSAYGNFIVPLSPMLPETPSSSKEGTSSAPLPASARPFYFHLIEEACRLYVMVLLAVALLPALLHGLFAYAAQTGNGYTSDYGTGRGFVLISSLLLAGTYLIARVLYELPLVTFLLAAIQLVLAAFSIGCDLIPSSRIYAIFGVCSVVAFFRVLLRRPDPSSAKGRQRPR